MNKGEIFIIPICNDWKKILFNEFHKPYYLKLRETLKAEYKNEKVYPDMHDLFSAFQYTSYQHTKVVIVGQDPYHGEGQAHGFSFSVKPGVKVPPSLKNIYKELQNDLGIIPPNHGHLISWAKEGVLLLNTVLTVRADTASSHRGLGWEEFTDAVIQKLNDRNDPIVFMLWGRQSQMKVEWIDRHKHKVIMSSHPSPLAAHRGFLGSRPFSEANEFLKSVGKEPVDWKLPSDPTEPKPS